ncbi:hypothetical protein I552_3398 [Mycobacterium xenopi 3993]|nr:hypothetical protein I552_3398 [Mycobacterium xenopi 3993]
MATAPTPHLSRPADVPDELVYAGGGSVSPIVCVCRRREARAAAGYRWSRREG